MRRLLLTAAVVVLSAPTAALASGETLPTETADPSPTATPTATTTPSTTPDPAAAFTVDDAQLRWGLNDESNNAAFAPGTYNFLSAGQVPDPGSGGRTIRNGRWSHTDAVAWWASRGKVRIEKRTADGRFVAATFAGLSTDASGARITSPTSGRFSGHQVVVDGGRGSVDPRAGTATVSWTGSFSVVHYSGMSYFVVSDPRLVVTRSEARLTGTLSGYASDRDDPTRWTAMPRQTVTLANLPRSQVALPARGGFTATPAYAGVRYDAPAAGIAQVRSGPHWGAFPSGFLGWLDRAGSAAYWYSSGGATDAYKTASPLAVSWSADDPVAPPSGPAQPGSTTTVPASPSAPAAPLPPPPGAGGQPPGP
ncbi:hypothetical protein, partial [Nocardioides sp. SYSU D00038]|uniref:hypothetical protein n=1 Tax=Nocardioides sp. SYSU D00038 TaxID=2812554 RepID=UPI0019686F79